MFLVFSGWRTTKTCFCATAWPVSSTFASESYSTIEKKGLNAQQWRLHHCKIPHKNLKKLTKKLCFQTFFGFVYTCPYKSWSLSTSKHTIWLKQESYFENQRTWNHIDEFFCFGSKMPKAKRWLHVSYDFSYFKWQINLGLIAGRWPKNLHYRNIPCLNTLMGSVRYLITLLKYSLFHYIVELYPDFLQCWAKPISNTLLGYILSYYIAKQFSKTNTLLSYTQS